MALLVFLHLYTSVSAEGESGLCESFAIIVVSIAVGPCMCCVEPAGLALTEVHCWPS